MSARHLAKVLDVTKHVPLWRRPIPEYPLYWKGNPQLRVFLPMFWMKMIRPMSKVPPNHVLFEVHPQMTKYDIKNYLEKIYNIDVLTVRTAVVQGKQRHCPKTYIKLSPEPDKRLAFVTLVNETFEFPDILADKQKKQKEEIEDFKEQKLKKEENEWVTNNIPGWFAG